MSGFRPMLLLSVAHPEISMWVFCLCFPENNDRTTDRGSKVCHCHEMDRWRARYALWDCPIQVTSV
jgi:hypothetical protein